MVSPKFFAASFLGLVLITGCGENQTLDTQAIKEIGANLNQQIEQFQKDNPEIQKKAEDLIDTAVSAINEKVDLEQVTSELLETTKFDSLRGFYNQYSPFDEATGIESLDALIEKVKSLHGQTDAPSTDMNGLASEVVTLALGDKLTEYGLSEEQIADFLQYVETLQ